MSSISTMALKALQNDLQELERQLKNDENKKKGQKSLGKLSDILSTYFSKSSPSNLFSLLSSSSSPLCSNIPYIYHDDDNDDDNKAYIVDEELSSPSYSSHQSEKKRKKKKKTNDKNNNSLIISTIDAARYGFISSIRKLTFCRFLFLFIILMIILAICFLYNINPFLEILKQVNTIQESTLKQMKLTFHYQSEQDKINFKKQLDIDKMKEENLHQRKLKIISTIDDITQDFMGKNVRKTTKWQWKLFGHEEEITTETVFNEKDLDIFRRSISNVLLRAYHDQSFIDFKSYNDILVEYKLIDAPQSNINDCNIGDDCDIGDADNIEDNV